MEDRFKKEIKVNDRVLFIYYYYKGRFYDYALGTIIGFTECFIKIKPDEQYIITYQEKEYILRKYNRVIRL